MPRGKGRKVFPYLNAAGWETTASSSTTPGGTPES